jgi:trigger factor
MLNVQTEHLENHTARITAEVDAEQINQVMRQAARQIAKQARIPGFRPGKAPFNVIVTMFGYDYVLGEALDKVGNDLYREALEKSGIEPYAAGSLEEVKEGGQKIVFVVPKQPTVELGDYRAVRVEHEPIEVTDEMLDRALERMREDEALVEDVDRPARYGDQVMLSHVEVRLVPLDKDDEAAEDELDKGDEEDEDQGGDEDDEAEEIEEQDDEDDDEDEDESDDDDDLVTLFHEHNHKYILYEDPEKEELFPGFAAELVDAVAGNELVFFLDVPEDDEDDQIAGRKLECEAHVEQVHSRIVPEWTDDLAKRISDGESETLLELRIKTRKSLEETAENMTNRDVALKALDEITKTSTIKYPDELVQDYITDFVKSLEQNIRRQGLKLEDWLRITHQTQDDLREQYRQAAVARAERALVLSEFVRQEHLTVSADEIDSEIDQLSKAFGSDEQAEQFKQFFASDQSRFNIQNDLLTDRAMIQLAGIAKGENPPVGAPAASTPGPGEEAASEAESETASDTIRETGSETTGETTGEVEPAVTPGETTE